MHLIKPLTIAFKGKGLATLFRRMLTIGHRYGFTAAKMDRSLGQLSNLLQQFDCRATLPITTVALARNGRVIRKYQTQGIEFAIHGYRHIDHSQLSRAEQESHLRKASRIFEEHGIKFEGFRCPYLRWNQETLDALDQTNFSYDSSSSLVWDIDQKHYTESYSRALAFYGAQPAKEYLAVPSLDTVKDLVRIPYCLPDDESLVERLSWDSATERDEIWPTMFQEIHAHGELFGLGLHPERTVDCAGGLTATLKKIRAVDSEVWRAGLGEVANWWKARYKAAVEISGNGDHCLQLSVDGPPGTTLMLRSLDAKTTTVPCFNGYQRATDLPAVISCRKRPFIGVSPECAPALVSFLKQQGYIVEISSQPGLYSYYLDQRTFSRAEERSMVAQIEADGLPLARLGRWPHGKRSAFCVTGDIDALTLWDYGLRFVGY